jgi:hypothetical protein
MDSDSEEDLAVMDSDVETDSEEEFDDDIDIEIDHIYYEDAAHAESNKTNLSYYIGLSYFSRYENSILFSNSISNRSFFRHSIYNVVTYLKTYSIFCGSRSQVDIMKLHISNNGTYAVVLKTFWLRLIQRTWKKMFARQKQILRKRATPRVQLYYQCHGKYPRELRYVPTLHGMFSNSTQ